MRKQRTNMVKQPFGMVFMLFENFRKPIFLSNA